MVLRRRLWRSLTAQVILVGSAVLLSACGSGGTNTITVYNGQHLQLTHALALAFEKRTGIDVKVRSDDAIVLANQILVEGSRSPADVFMTENSPELILLSEQSMLEKLPAATLAEVPSRYNSPTGNWVGVSLRVGGLAYNPSRIEASQLPASVLDLAMPEWKGKLAISPTDSDFVPLVGAVIATEGRAAAKRWLEGLRDNTAFYQDAEAVVVAVNRGRAAVGIVNAYYWYRLRLELGEDGMHSKLYFFPHRDVGGLENIAGAAVLSSAKNKADAEEFVAFLVSAVAQRILTAGNTYEYPTHPGIAPNPALPPLSALKPSIIDVIRLGNDRAAAVLLQEVGLT